MRSCQVRRTSWGETAPPATSRSSIEWKGPRRRSVGDPGLRIQTPLVPLDLRQVRMAVEHGVAAREAPNEALLPARTRAGNVDDPDPRPAGVHDELLRQQLPERGLVRIPVDGVDGRAEQAQLLEHGQRGEVAGVEDHVGRPQPVETCLGEPSGSPRQMRVGDRRDEHGEER